MRQLGECHQIENFGAITFCYMRTHVWRQKFDFIGHIFTRHVSDYLGVSSKRWIFKFDNSDTEVEFNSRADALSSFVRGELFEIADRNQTIRTA